MDFFCCPCPVKGTVILDGNEQGPNKDESGDDRTLQCGSGKHRIALNCLVGRTCKQESQLVNVSGTNPILPLEVSFQCES